MSMAPVVPTSRLTYKGLLGQLHDEKALKEFLDRRRRYRPR